MPRSVVPMLSPPVAWSSTLSSAMCQGKTTCARSLSIRLLADVDALGRQRVDLLEDRRRVDDHAGRDDVHHARRQNAAGNVVQLVGLVADDDRMPGVGPALIADDDLVPRGQQIDELPLGLVAPLQTDHARSRHDRFSDRKHAARPKVAAQANHVS